ncbi:hypothetical protein BC008_28060 [Mastigocoleus testarum BC008]|uniref:Uncharacterized protein n=1 Tax=Mastigocoleus testarum BC008 TaxID=371196 RepID=A0A0V7ZRS4_9CYAN|nr:hypothetical protein BC008_28060 [Mastigocoleus testarum BC008]
MQCKIYSNPPRLTPQESIILKSKHPAPLTGVRWIYLNIYNYKKETAWTWLKISQHVRIGRT